MIFWIWLGYVISEGWFWYSVVVFWGVEDNFYGCNVCLELFKLKNGEKRWIKIMLVVIREEELIEERW